MFTNYLPAAYASFDSGVILPNVDHIARIFMSSWLSEPVVGQPGLSWLREVGQSLAAVGRIPHYTLKSVSLTRVGPGDTFRWYDRGWTTLPWGSGWTDEQQADGFTWALDIVFRPSTAGAKNESGGKHQEWLDYLSQISPRPHGQPVPYFSSIVPLTSEQKFSDPNLQAWYERTRIFWASQQPYWEIISSPSQTSVSGYDVQISRIYNQAADTAWKSFPPYIGTNGFGYAMGSADNPDSLGALSVALPKPNDPAMTSVTPVVDNIKAIARGFQGASTTNLAAIGAVALIGAFGAWYLADKLIWDRRQT